MAATASFLTTSITKLELLCHGVLIATATGFFLKRAEHWSIATNWHVLSGRNPHNGQPKHKAGLVPDTCRYYVFELSDESLNTRAIDVPLGDALLGEASWLQHPNFGQKVDIAVLPLTTSDIGSAKDLLAKDGHDENMFVDIGGEVFLPGYPLGFSAGAQLPIWKRASLASSLEFEPGLSSTFFVDTATREGMSGAPCLSLANWRYYRLDRGTNKMSVINRPLSWRLLGIYSGRRNPSDGFEAQIGIVWRETLLFSVLNGRSRAHVALA